MEILDLGHLAYRPAWETQLHVAEEVIAGTRPESLIFVEHDPVITLGAGFHAENLLRSELQYSRAGIELVKTDRGGDVTYHGPGQLVIYPIFDLTMRGKDLHRYLRDLEQTMLDTLQAFGLAGRRFPPHTGAWVEDRKIAAIGVRIRRWVTLHGIALNCSNDINAFNLIVPCGIQGFGVTSLSQELAREVTIDEAKPLVQAAFESIFA